MKFSARELILSWVTGLVLLLLLSYWLVNPRVEAWREMRTYKDAMRTQMNHARRLVDQRSDWMERLEKLRQSLTGYPAERDVTADYLRLLERLAAESKLTLVQRRAQPEKPFGDLFELLIDCTWEGDLEALVRFMYAVEKEETAMDIDELSVSLISGADGRIKGNFTVVCVYSRLPASAADDTARNK